MCVCVYLYVYLYLSKQYRAGFPIGLRNRGW